MTQLTKRIIYFAIIIALIGRLAWHLIPKQPSGTNIEPEVSSDSSGH
jgi:hypothetical protein